VAFIDSEMARKRSVPVSAFHPPTQRSDYMSEAEAAKVNATIVADRSGQASGPTAPRQLSEVDLGTSAHDKNLARIHAALDRVKAGQTPIEDDVKPSKPRKPRLGRDGKPWRPPPRKRRNSEDVARDALVEQFLHENKIDMYDTTTPPPKNDKDQIGDDNGNGDTDERFAEQFRQEFMDAVAERKTKNKPPLPTKGAAVVDAKGPKLGGSRSARQKMAQMQQEQGSQPPKK
jgi:hypothetical protein